MKIAYVCNEYPPRPHGGIGTFVHTIAHGMTAAGHHVTVVGYGVTPGEWQDGEVRVVTIPETRTRGTAWLLNRLRLHQWLAREVEARGLDLIEVPEFGGLLPFPLRCCPVVVRLHLAMTVIDRQAGKEHSGTIGWCEWSTLRSHPAWIFVSRYSGRVTRETFRLEPRRFAVIYCPIVLPELGCEEGPSLPERFIFYAGTVSARKGALALAEACKSLLQEDDGLHLVYAGGIDGDADGRTDERINRIFGFHLQSRVHFLGRLDRSAVLACMRKTCVMAFPSRLESFGLVVAEAMACGTPVVYSTTGPGPEVVEDGVSGLLADPDHPDDIAEKIRRILGDPDLGRCLGHNAIVRVKERFSLDRCVRESVRFYEDIITERKARKARSAVK